MATPLKQVLATLPLKRLSCRENGMLKLEEKHLSLPECPSFKQLGKKKAAVKKEKEKTEPAL